MTHILKQIEKALRKEQKEKEDRLARDLKKRIISTETYDRKIRDIERWASKERGELKKKQRMIDENLNDVSEYIDRLKIDK